MAHASTQPKGRLYLYRSYNFVDKDPAIDKVRTIVAKEGLKHHEIQYLSGVSAHTLHEWFFGKTMRPQHATLAAVAASLGYDWTLVKKKDLDYEKELPRARDDWRKQHSGKNGHARARRK